MSTAPYDLELRAVAKRFDGVVAVDDVSIAVPSGEFLSLLGPSGCGKTTTLRLIAGFETPSAGTILLQGKPVERVPPNRRDVNTVFQHYALFPHLTVAENIAYPLSIRKRSRAEIDERVGAMLKVVRLEGLEPRYPHQLSGGQQQRVALARALVNRPAVLLLDEPLGALDLKVRRHMQVELKKIQREVGITFVYVTHDQEEALTLSDRVAVMNEGRVEQIGPPAEIYDHPVSRFALEFVGASNLVGGRTRAGDGATVAIDSDIGPLCGPAGAVAPGRAVLVGVRPEKITLCAAAGEGNSLPGTVSETTFQGVLAHHRVRLDGGGELLVYRQTIEGNATASPWSPGARVWATWSPSNTLVFPA